MTAPNQLFQSMLSSEIKGDLLVLFHKNPGLIDSLDGVARRIGRVGTAIQADVQDMVNVRILGTKQIGGREIIFLDRSGDSNTKFRNRIDSPLVDFLDPEKRIEKRKRPNMFHLSFFARFQAQKKRPEAPTSVQLDVVV